MFWNYDLWFCAWMWLVNNEYTDGSVVRLYVSTVILLSFFSTVAMQLCKPNRKRLEKCRNYQPNAGSFFINACKICTASNFVRFFFCILLPDEKLLRYANGSWNILLFSIHLLRYTPLFASSVYEHLWRSRLLLDTLFCCIRCISL